MRRFGITFLLLGLAGCASGASTGAETARSAMGGDCPIYAAALQPTAELGGWRPLPPLLTRYEGPDRSVRARGAMWIETYLPVAAITRTQLEEIAAAEWAAAAGSHTINCDWSRLSPAVTTKAVDDDGPETRLSVPVRSRDGRFAMIGIEVMRGGLDAVGAECLFEKVGAAWLRRQCKVHWVS